MSTPTLEVWPFPDPELGTTEQLFKRYLKEHWTKAGFSNVGLKFAPSFNRSKFSEAKDVLVDGDRTFEGWGVLACSVGDVGAKVVSGAGVAYRFNPVHKPEPHNYAHSELHPDPNPNQPPPKTVKKEYRVVLARQMTVIIESMI